MKYPQLVSMPSAVSDWLEEQLDARGIDAVVYTRYVLSLLQHHHSQDEDLGDLEHDFTQQHAKESSAGGKHPSGRGACSANKRLRRTWFQHVVRVADVEQLRRSAAVEALMSAAEQKCGIESLVDELCEKLKHFESNNTESTELKNAPAANSPKRTISPADLARKYYAAFPPLNNNNNNNNNLNGKSPSAKLLTLLPQICTQTSSTIQKRKHNNNRNHSNNSCTNRLVHKEKVAAAAARKSSDFDIMKSRSGGKQRLFLSTRTKKDYGFARNMAKSAERSDTSDWDVYFLNNRMGDEGYSTSDTTGVDESEDVIEMEQHDSLGNQKIDEAHLAKLVAKFDQRIEALWSTSDEQEIIEEHDLPVDIQELLASPEILNVANNKRVGDKATKSFIQCGTNITSSIWTECADNDEDDERSMYDSMSFSNFYNEQIDSYPEKMLGDQFNSLSVAAENNDIYSLENLRVAENEANYHFENTETNSFYNKFGAIKNNNFTSLPWEVAFPSNFNNKKWSDAENFNYIGEKFESPLLENNINIINMKRNINCAVNDSLITLNHNKEASCFKEVVPKQQQQQQQQATTDEATAIIIPPPPPQADVIADDPLNKVEEEDLLTSTRTHFRPIKQENVDSGASHGAGAHYADGTTFVIRSTLERINYRRSDSGTLYLESGFDTPKKYQEYRIKDITEQINRCDADTDTESCYSIEREFVLKFCVKQNEKCVQTETVHADEEQEKPMVALEAVSSPSPSHSHSPLEVPAKKRVLCDPEEFFFPGDEELLSDSVDGGAECSCVSRSRVKLATNLEPLFNATMDTCSLHGRDSTVAEIKWPEGASSWRKCDKCNNNWSAVWSKPTNDNDTNHLNPATVWGSSSNQSSGQSWQQIWSSSEELCRTCLGVPAGSGPPPGRSLEYFKLREELSEDGEQLLSDLSCLQRVYMEQLPSTEMSCDLNDLTATVPEYDAPQDNQTQPSNATTTTTTTTKLFGVNGFFGSNHNNIGSKERKRRHSSSQRSCEPIAAAVARNSWTNSACVRPELRCLFTPPLLRPVTL